jgi:hypothetical protein
MDRSLWLDEALLALNIINKSFTELAAPLDYNQGAPLGFLWVQKALTIIFGTNEYTLRFFPLISGIASLLVFAVIARKYLEGPAIFFASTIFAISIPLIYYSSEVKQYSVDVLIGLFGLLIFVHLLEKDLEYFSVVSYGLVGAILMWISHPIVFILASNGTIAIYISFLWKQYRKTSLIAAISLFWAISFLVLYFILLEQLIRNDTLLDYWATGFVPSLYNPMVTIEWFIENFRKIFDDPVGLSFPELAGLTFIVGAVTLFRRNKPYLFSLLMPLLFVFFAAFLQRYPFSGRLLLFAVPLLILLIGEGTVQIFNLLSSANLRLAGVFFLIFLFYLPLLQAGRLLSNPRLVEEIDPVIEYITSKRQDGDIVYLYYASQHPFEYYSSRYDFKANDYIIGISSRDDWSKYLADLDKLQNYKRVWLLFSHVHSGSGVNEEMLFLNYLKSIGGTQKDKYQTTGAAVYLYEFD